MSSKYYEILMNSDSIDESILKENIGGWSFEDHYWHFACLAYYYKQAKQDEWEKECLTKLCDMNYVFNALTLYDSFDVLPYSYKKYIHKFENNMVDPKIEDEINRFNKLAKKKSAKKYWLSSLTSLITIPIMLFLMLVLKLDSSLSIVIAIFVLLLVQTFTSPLMENTKLAQTVKGLFKRNKAKETIPQELQEYGKYLNRFIRIINNEHYLALARSKDENEAKEIAKTIKEKKIIV